ncbi:hypothetical protein HY967_01320 [Candidatus Jorgensenbacteria bacterium]|nr:hypothetical protein [Candidatus Jorgensenbacteria bacterium]
MNESRGFKTGSLKFIIGWAVCFIFRLQPFRPPNVEPIMATTMPFAKRYGWIYAFVFGFLSIVLFDIATAKVGVWTWVTGFTYGALGIAASLFFKNRDSRPKNYLGFAIVGTLVYDAITGVIAGPLFFGQSFTEAFMGQIPFTINHLLGNIVFALVVSPLLYRWVLDNEVFETDVIWRKVFKTV